MNPIYTMDIFINQTLIKLNEIVPLISFPPKIISSIKVIIQKNKHLDNKNLLSLLINYTNDLLSKNLTSNRMKIKNNTKISLNINYAFDHDKIQTFLYEILPKQVKKKEYIVLDRKNIMTEQEPHDTFTWNYENSMLLKRGSFNSRNDIKNIISIKLYVTEIPLINNLETNTQTITILIRELSAQAIQTSSKKYHFLFGLTDISIPRNGRYTLLNTGYINNYEFTEPLTHLSSMTINFQSKNNILSFKKYKFNVIFTSYGSVTSCQTDSDHELSNGDFVTFENFTTSNAGKDNYIIELINEKTGVAVTNVSNNTFDIDINTSTISQKADLKISCFVNKRHFILPMEITYMEEPDYKYLSQYIQ